MQRCPKYKVYYHQRRHGQFFRGRTKKWADEDMSIFAKAHECFCVLEIRLFVHKGLPTKTLRATLTTPQTVQITNDHFNLEVPIEDNAMEILFPKVGEEIQFRHEKGDPVFWIAIKQPAIKTTKKAEAGEKHSGKKFAKKNKFSKKKNTVRKRKRTENADDEDGQPAKKKKKKFQQKLDAKRQKNKRTKKKMLQERKKKQLSKQNNLKLLKSIAVTQEKNNAEKLQVSKTKVDKYEKKVKKKEALIQGKKKRIQSMQDDFEKKIEKKATKAKKKTQRKIKFADEV